MRQQTLRNLIGRDLDRRSVEFDRSYLSVRATSMTATMRQLFSISSPLGAGSLLIMEARLARTGLFAWEAEPASLACLGD